VKAKSLEVQVFKKYAGLDFDKDVKIYDIKIYPEEHPARMREKVLTGYETMSIHTIEINRAPEGAETLVILHGFLGSAWHFYQVAGELSKHFKLYIIDTPGQGMSSRPYVETEGSSTELLEWFYSTSLELWR
jgi:alpha-beta hydrolase superfamily lysophospholipase